MVPNLFTEKQVYEPHAAPLSGDAALSGGCGQRCAMGATTGLTDPGVGEWEKCLEKLRTRGTLAQIKKSKGQGTGSGLMNKVSEEEHDSGKKTKEKLDRCEVPHGDTFAQKWCWQEG